MRKILLLLVALVSVIQGLAQYPYIERGFDLDTLIPDFYTSTPYSFDYRVREDGAIFATGFFDDTLVFGFPPSIDTLVPTGSRSMYAARLDSNWQTDWIVPILGTDVIRPYSLTFDSHGNLIICGEFEGKVDFDPTIGVDTLVTQFQENGFILSLSDSGTLNRVVDIGDSSEIRIENVLINNQNEMIVEGIYGTLNTSIDFQPGSGVSYYPVSPHVSKGFLLKLDSLWNFEWVHVDWFPRFDCNFIDDDLNIYVSGTCSGNASFQTEQGVVNFVNSNSNGFVSKIRDDGDIAWIYHPEPQAAANDYMLNLAVDSSDNVYFTGCFTEDLYLSTPTGYDTIYSTYPFRDYYIVKLDSSGQFKWFSEFIDVGSPRSYGILIDENQNPLIYGDYWGNVTYKKDTNVMMFDVDSTGSRLAFLLSVEQTGEPRWYDYLKNTDWASFKSAFFTNQYQLFLNGNYQVYADLDFGQGSHKITAKSFNPKIFFASYNMCDPDTIYLDQPTLVDVIGECSVIPDSIPTAHSDCGEVLTGVPDVTFPITSPDTTVVTWTFDDSRGNIAYQTQLFIVDDIFAPSAPSLPTIYGDCSVQLSIPTINDTCSGVITGVTSDTLFYDQEGVYNVNWSFDDGNGNSTAVVQQVIVDDTIAPVAPNLPDIIANCSTQLTVPQANDNCLGIVNGSTNSPLTYSSLGIYFIDWVFDDGNGNVSQVTQKVTIQDTLPPSADLGQFMDSTVWCSFSPTPPIAYDSCSGMVIGQTSQVFPISDTGYTTIQWSFADGNGNSINHSQTIYLIDTLAPVPTQTSLPLIEVFCEIDSNDLTAPFAMDNCFGSIEGNTNFNFSTHINQDTFIVWSYLDNNGNVSVQKQWVKSLDFNTSITQLDSVLTVGETGVSYQWIDCTSMAPLMGETNQSLTVPYSGVFAVEVSEGMCVDTSDCYSYIFSGINDLYNQGWRVYPNPSNGIFTIESKLNESYSIDIYSLHGVSIYGTRVVLDDKHQVDLKNRKGVYLLVISSVSGKFTEFISIR